MILLNSTDTLQVLLAGSITTNQAVLYAAFADMAADGSTFAPGSSNGLTNNTTAVSWMASPASGNIRQAKYLSLYNADTVSITATVRINDGSNTRIICKVPLATGERLEYSVDGGFRVITASGTTGMLNPMTTTGDMIYGGASGLPTRLAVGSSTNVLTVTGGVPVWAAPPVLSVNGATGTVVLGGESIAEPVSSISSSSGVLNFDCSTGDYFKTTLTENITSITFSNLPASNKAQTIMWQMTQHASSAKTVAWPSSFKWAGGSAGTVSSATSAIDVLAITTFDQGTTWRATLAKAFA